jgi:hypothetical protein
MMGKAFFEKNQQTGEESGTGIDQEFVVNNVLNPAIKASDSINTMLMRKEMERLRNPLGSNSSSITPLKNGLNQLNRLTDTVNHTLSDDFTVEPISPKL